MWQLVNIIDYEVEQKELHFDTSSPFVPSMSECSLNVQSVNEIDSEEDSDETQMTALTRRSRRYD